MNTKNKTTAETNKNAEFAARLKLAREEKRYTRSALAKETGIPEKSLEKFEYGNATPTIERLYTLADKLGVTIQFLLDGEASENQDELGENVNDNLSEISIEDKCAHIDVLREEGLQFSWRTAPRLIVEIKNELQTNDLDYMLDLAEVRGLFAIEPEAVSEISNMKDELPVEITERILDTLYFGVDLYTICKKDLKKLADELKLKSDEENFWGPKWSGTSAIVAALRSKCRQGALKGIAPDFEDEETFKQREIA